MNLDDLLRALDAAQVSLATRDGELIVTAEKGAVGTDLRQALQVHKNALIESLRCGEASTGVDSTAPVPANAITQECRALTPDMLPLIDLNQADIDRIVSQVPGGLANLQDIYELSPLQEGILFHHLLATEGDPYLIVDQMSFTSRTLLDRFVAAVQTVVNRHDILRTAFVWEELSTPAQVVWRHAPIDITELTLDPRQGPISQQLTSRFDPRHQRIDLGRAPLLRFAAAHDEANDRWLLVQHLHHLIDDISSLQILHEEVRSILAGRGASLSRPQPFRDVVAQARSGRRNSEHERFFRDMLGDIDEPTIPFGLADVHLDGSGVADAHLAISPALNARLRALAPRFGVSMASVCHLAWGLVLARSSGRSDVVFGTVLFGRMHAGAERAMGLFINTLPLRLNLGSDSVVHSLRHTHEALAELLSHEHASLALAQRCSGVQAPSPLFTALLNYRHNTRLSAPDKSIEGMTWLGGEERTNYPISLSVEDYGDALGLTVQSARPLSPHRIAEYMVQSLDSLADALEDAPDGLVSGLEVLPQGERALLLDQWNRTESDYPENLCIHQLFERQVLKTPNAMAVQCGEELVSYIELDERANRLAAQLIALGAATEARVAICLDRSTALVVALLAILKSGGAYVPLDPAYPSDRCLQILRDADPLLVLADAAGQRALGAAALADYRVIDPTAAWVPEAEMPTESVLGNVASNSRHLAYVIYTSGSTGTPKGVMVEHRSMVNHIAWQASRFGFGPSDVFLQRTSPAFDAAGWELWTPLAIGAKLVLLPSALGQDAQAIFATAAAHRVTVLQVVPSLLGAFTDEDFPCRSDSLRYLFCGGEALSADLVSRASGLASEGLVNLYGPTETTIDATAWLADEFGAELLPIGRPIANTRLYVLDAERRPVPLGAPGELYIGGAGVARGYLNQPALTAERFLPDPFFSSQPQARMYRTGDLARYRPDGALLFLGRNDQQVKIRGFRIEPGEIEARLLEHPAVREAVVLALDALPSEPRLIAYVVADADASALRAHLGKCLPAYMLPAAFVPIDKLPLTANGKLDRKALPPPPDTAFARDAYLPPEGEIETTLASLWSELLSVPRVGRRDNFFALGGHSLLAIRLMERLRRLRLGTNIRNLFDTPVLCDLANTLGSQHDVPVPPNLITPQTTALTPDMLPLIDLNQADIDHILSCVPGGLANLQDIYALSPLQDGILFHHLLAAEGDTYLLVSQLAFTDRPLLDRYLAAMQTVVDRHDILRTAFVWEGVSMPAQVVWRRASLRVDEAMLDASGGAGHEQLARRFDARHYRVDLGKPPLLRCVIAREPSSDRWLLAQLQHHLIGDHATLETLSNEIGALVAHGRAAVLPTAYPYRSVVAAARLGLDAQAHERYFRELLGDVDEPTAAFGLVDTQADASGADEASCELPQELSDQLHAQARRLGVTVASLCHLAWAQVLARSSGRTTVVFGTVLFGRMHAGQGADSAMGLFINTLPLRLDLDRAGVEESARHTHARLADLLRHEHASLAAVQRCSLVAAPTPLFSTLLNYRHNKPRIAPRAGLEGIEWLGAQERTNYPITISVEDGGHTLGLTVQAMAPLSPHRFTGYMRQALESLANALASDPEQAALDTEVLPPDERKLLLQDWNHVEPGVAQSLCLHEWFEQHAQRQPEAVALVCGDERVTYAELNTRANRWAHRLIAHGVRPDVLVALCVSRGTAMVVALLAILKAGGAYVPLDPAYPSERLARVLADAHPLLVLTDATGRAALGNHGQTEWKLDAEDCDSSATTAPCTNPDARALGLTPQHLAYVIHTSGSSGTPKGVMVEHAHVTRLFDATRALFDFGPADVGCLFHSIAFDFSVWELWGALRYGARLVIVAHETARSTPLFHRLVCELGVTVLNQTPTAFKSFIDADQHSTLPHRLRLVIFGGEALELASLAPWYLRHPDTAPRLVNMYGITETTVHVTHHALCRADLQQRGSPIGRRLPDLRLYLLDPRRQPVPLGAVGELYVGGAGVARGYLHQPALTAERFLPDPYSPQPQARMYRTGDLARYRPDGTLLFLGRNDQQVKIRGFRIELGEIEARLLEHPAVREAVVLALDALPSEPRLIAYVVADAQADAAALRAHLSERLPAYMLPAAFVPIDKLPLTTNGKLDRKALPAPPDAAFAHDTYLPPEGEIETTLASLWSELLGVPRVGRHDNFFALGGHSLLAVRLMEQLRRVRLGTNIRNLFAMPVLSDLATTLGSQHDVPVPPNQITPQTTALTPNMLPLIDLNQAEIDHILGQVPGGLANVQDIYGLSPLQEGILFHHLLATEGDPYLIVDQMSFTSRTLLDCFVAALQTVVDRHDILRTAFVWEKLSTPAQVVWRHAPIGITELTLDPRGGPMSQQLALRFDPRHQRIDLGRAPLLRFAAAHDLANDRWLLVQHLHHLVNDNSSLQILHEEVRSILAGCGALLPRPQQFRDVVAQARLGFRDSEHERFFRDMLGDIDEPTIPFGLADVHRDGSGVADAHLAAPPALNARLRVLAARFGVSMASVCHLAWGLVLARSSGRSDVVFGTVLFGRMHTGADRAMGLFINTLPLRLNLGSDSVAHSLHRTHEALAELLSHEHASLALAQRCSLVAAPSPLFTALLNYRHNARLSAPDKGIEGMAWLGGEGHTNYPISLSVEDYGDALGLTVQAAQPLSPERIAAYMLQSLESVADALDNAPDGPVSNLEVLPPGERALLLDQWNRTESDYPETLCIHQLFERQVLRTPGATAVQFGEESLSYVELDERANRLAAQLIALGAITESRVAICLDRSPLLVVALLAILKSGSAYVPLDPAYPSDRWLQILRDTDPLLVLADAAGQRALGAAALAGYQVIDPMAALPPEAETPGTPVLGNVGLNSRHLAYVIYTSGSTGTPKGVMVEHRSMVNHITWQVHRFEFGPSDVFLQKTSPAFDAAGLELWTPLAVGAKIVLLPSALEQDARAIFATADAHRVTLLQVVPSLLGAFIDEDFPHRSESLRYLFCGGEALSADLVNRARGLASQGLVNLYGPTETTIDATAWLADEFGAEPVPIGRPIANTRLYVLDAGRRPVPLGAVGELYVGGAGVARGYLNQPALTAERFLPDPFSPQPQARMYRTGDLARYRPDGTLLFLGRNDQQVKIHGFRIELGEIEARLLEHPAVREAVVLARNDARHEPRLVAYIVPSDETELPKVLHAYLAARLPRYMVPSIFMRIKSLPLTPGAKLDRNALPAPEDNSLIDTPYEAPEGEVETTLAAIWMNLLAVDRIDRRDSFFAQGGHSLLAVKLVNLAAARNIRLGLGDVFTHPELLELARRARPMTVASATADQALIVREGPPGPPLFFVPTGQGDYSYVFLLATHIGTECPIFALPWQAPDEVPIDSIEAMADRMMGMVRAVQPHGPYRLAGYSSGGILVYAIAAGLQRARETVSFAGLIDVTAPGALPRETQSAKRLALDSLAEQDTDESHAQLARDLRGRLDRLTLRDIVGEWDRCRARPSGADNLDAEVRHWEQRALFFATARRYSPVKLPLRVHQFFALGDDPTQPNPTEDASHGWAALVPDSLLHMIPIPGGHLSMMSIEVNRAVLGRRITEVLRLDRHPTTRIAGISQEIQADR